MAVRRNNHVRHCYLQRRMGESVPPHAFMIGWSTSRSELCTSAIARCANACMSLAARLVFQLMELMLFGIFLRRRDTEYEKRYSCKEVREERGLDAV